MEHNLLWNSARVKREIGAETADSQTTANGMMPSWELLNSDSEWCWYQLGYPTFSFVYLRIYTYPAMILGTRRTHEY